MPRNPPGDPSLSLKPGHIVDRYVVQELLGQGGMASVYRVKHSILGTQHALKVLHRTSERHKKDLIQEGRLQARLDPQYIVPVNDVLFLNGNPALLMPLVQGCSLAEVLREYSPNEAETAAIISAIGRGMADAHESGIIHRDLKPANILLDIHRGMVRIRVADFGLGTMVQQSMVQSGFSGTAAYAPPEQLSGSVITPSADLWPLGAILMECLVGRRPYRAANVAGMIQAIKEGKPDLEGIPKAWTGLIERLLEPDPNQRGPSARRLGSAAGAIAKPDPLRESGQLAMMIRRVRGGDTLVPDGLDTLDAASEGVSDAKTNETILGTYDPFVEVSIVPTVGNIQSERNEFIARDAELKALHAHLSSATRIVTVSGTAGCGKSRIVIRYAHLHGTDWPAGVWHCDLASSTSLHELCQAIAATLNLNVGPSESVAAIQRALQSRGKLLLILDNFERLASSALSILTDWVKQAPNCTFLITSRETLRTSTETVWRVPEFTPEQSRALFLSRARTVHASYAPDASALRAIDQLAAALGHLPLAIELAASRIAVMGPDQILTRIHQRFKVLSTSGEAPGRHMTLRAALDSSWEILAAHEQATLLQMAVFNNLFDLEAAEAVIDLDAFEDAPWIIDVIQSLVSKSLIQPAVDSYFSLPTNVFSYVKQKLSRSDLAPSVEQRHGEYYASFGHPEAVESLYRHDGVTLRTRLAKEQGNLLLALQRAVQAGRKDIAYHTATIASELLLAQGPFAKAAELADQVLTLPDLSNSEKAQLHVLSARAHRQTRSFKVAEQRAQAALDLASQAQDDPIKGRALGTMGMIHLYAGRSADASSAFHSALSLASATNNFHLTSLMQGALGVLCWRKGDHPSALNHYEQALATHRNMGDRRYEAIILGNMGLVHLERSELARSQSCLERALSIHREVGNRTFEGMTLSNLGSLHLRKNAYRKAKTYYQQALTVHKKLGNLGEISLLYFNIGDLLYKAGKLESSARSLTMSEGLAVKAMPVLVGIIHGTHAKIHARNGNAEQALQCLHEGETILMRSDFKSEVAKFMAKKATVYAHLGEKEQADSARTIAQSMHEELGGKDIDILIELQEAQAARGLLQGPNP